MSEILKFTFDHDEKGGIFKAYIEQELAGTITFLWEAENVIMIDHTHVLENFNGRGIAKQLVLHAAEFAKENNYKVVPMCGYAAKVFQSDEALMQLVNK